MSATLVNCALTDPIVPEEKFRVTFSQGAIEHWLAGGTLSSIYQSLSTSPWAYPVSEPPIDDAPVFVLDLRVRQSTSGGAPPGTVVDMVQQLGELSFYNAYDVTRVERLSTTSRVLEQRSVVKAEAVIDQQASGIAGLYTRTQASLQKAFGGVGGILIAGAVIAAAITVVVVVRAARSATA
jgi:hypothetical protein